MEDSAIRSGRLILVPALITAVVTLLRLTGERLEWSPVLFNRSAGGGLAVVGIVWLIPIFGVYFGLRLARAGERPSHVARALGLVFLALVLIPAVAFGAAAMRVAPRPMVVAFSVASVVAVLVAVRAWPALGRTLVIYGLAARVPVAIVMLLAMLGGWGTHYDAPTPGFPDMLPLTNWFWTGFLPQLTMWIAVTVVIGLLFGVPAAAIFHRER